VEININKTAIEELQKTCYDLAKAKGFHENPVEIGTSLMLIVSELSEALEALRHNKRTRLLLPLPEGELEDSFFEKVVKDTYEDELADVAIRLFDLAESTNVDLAWHIEKKLKYNMGRPHLHGKSF